MAWWSPETGSGYRSKSLRRLVMKWLATSRRPTSRAYLDDQTAEAASATLNSDLAGPRRLHPQRHRQPSDARLGVVVYIKTGSEASLRTTASTARTDRDKTRLRPGMAEIPRRPRLPHRPLPSRQPSGKRNPLTRIHRLDDRQDDAHVRRFQAGDSGVAVRSGCAGMTCCGFPAC
jgi:hypothetical protein